MNDTNSAIISLLDIDFCDLDADWNPALVFQEEQLEAVTPPTTAGWLLCEPTTCFDLAFEYLHKLDGADGASLCQILTLYRKIRTGSWSAKVRLDAEPTRDAEHPPVTTPLYATANLAFRAAVNLAEGQLSDYKRGRARRADAVLANLELHSRLVAETVHAHLYAWSDTGLPPTYKFDAAYLQDACSLAGVEREPLFGASLIEQGIQRAAQLATKSTYTDFLRIGAGLEFCTFQGQMVLTELATDWALTSPVDSVGICGEILEYSRGFGDKSLVQTIIVRLGPDNEGYSVEAQTAPASDARGMLLTPEKGLESKRIVARSLPLALKSGLDLANEQARFFFRIDSERTSNPIETATLPGNGSAVYHKGDFVIASLYGGTICARAVSASAINVYLRFSDIHDNDITEQVSRASGCALTKNGLRVEKAAVWEFLQTTALRDIAQDNQASTKTSKTPKSQEFKLVR